MAFRSAVGLRVIKFRALADALPDLDELGTNRAPQVATVMPRLGGLHRSIDILRDVLKSSIDQRLRGLARFSRSLLDAGALGNLFHRAGRGIELRISNRVF